LEKIEGFKQTYGEMIQFLTDIESLDLNMHEYCRSFPLKMFGFEEMHHGTLDMAKKLEEAVKKEDPKTTEAWKRTIAYFEAYLNSIYSLLQVITKITLIVYKTSKNQIQIEDMGDNFGCMVNYLRTKKTVDPEFTKYLDSNMEWYRIFKENRHKITHNGSNILMFDKDGKTMFVNFPKSESKLFDEASDKAGNVLFPDKTLKNLEDYLKKNIEDLFAFLAFYVKHFRTYLA
jgi:hypothetical protein